MQRQRNTTPNFEPLEPRRFLDAVPTPDLTAGTLTITGTEKHDVIIVSLNPVDSTQLLVRANNQHFTFDLSDVNNVTINALGGSDRVIVSEKYGPITLPFTVDAGLGNYFVQTASGDDILLGGGGNDILNGGAGNDQIDGGGGNDVLNGAAGNDNLTGDAGHDNLNGNAGDDDLDGGASKDNIRTGAGDDQVAIDPAAPKEVKDHNPNDQHYIVADFADLPTEIQQLHAQKVPGSTVVKCQILNGIVTMKYTFGNDPKIYTTVVDAAGAELQLISRELSPEEWRAPAIDAFNQYFPDATILSLTEGNQTHYSIRYRDADGSLKTITSHEIVFGLDDADRDLDNNGIEDGSSNPSFEELFPPST